MYAEETVEDELLIFLADALALVAHPDDRFVGLSLYADRHGLAGRAILDSVADQVIQYLLYTVLVTWR